MSSIVYTDYYKSNEFISLEEVVSSTKCTEVFNKQMVQEFYKTFQNQSRLNHIAICEKSKVIDIFSDLIEKSLELTKIDRNDIAYIMYTDYMNTKINNVQVPYYLVEKFSLNQAKIITIQQGCAGTLFSMGISNSILNETRKYMLVLSSSIVDEKEDRFLGYTAWADGVGIMIISYEESHNNIVDWNSHYNCLDFYNGLQQEDNNRSNIVNEGIKLVRNMVTRNDLRVEKLEKFIPQNIHYNAYVYQYGRVMGLREEQLYLKNISKIGHAGDVDTIINIHDYESEDLETKLQHSVVYGMGGDNAGRCYHSVLLKKS